MRIHHGLNYRLRLMLYIMLTLRLLHAVQKHIDKLNVAICETTYGYSWSFLPALLKSPICLTLHKVNGDLSRQYWPVDRNPNSFALFITEGKVICVFPLFSLISASDGSVVSDTFSFSFSETGNLVPHVLTKINTMHAA